MTLSNGKLMPRHASVHMSRHQAFLQQSQYRLLTPTEMACADAAAIAFGVAGRDLMENAGRAVAEAILSRWTPGKVLVACGPGNNGGDGFVVARYLAEAGWQVNVVLAGRREALRGDAAWHARQWTSDMHPLPEKVPQGVDLVVDALFGAGLTRPLEAQVAQFVQSLNASTIPVCAIDVPSGLDGATGQALGALAVQADMTVSFFRKKPGHLLLPGRQLCGDIMVCDIGIPAQVLLEPPLKAEATSPAVGLTFENAVSLWYAHYPWPRLDGHKYHRGHTVVIGGEVMTGAARLTATAAARIGSGLTSLLAPQAAVMRYAAMPASIMLHACHDDSDLQTQLHDSRKSVIVIGPGAGVSESLIRRTQHILQLQRTTVLDADVLTAFGAQPALLFQSIAGPCVLTPHEGEFSRLFPEISRQDDKLTRARHAARVSGAIVLLKGPDTVIAAPDGRVVINANAPATLATGGAGDVLAGMIAGLAAQGMPLFEACCAAVWLHGDIASQFGPGLIADDLPDGIPAALRRLQDGAGQHG